MKKKLVIISGPTGVGKTNLSIALAKLIGGEIISADSMQVYKYMDIGSAKVTVEEMDGVTHHLIDVLSPMDSFDVNRFQSMAYKAMDEIYERGHIPIIVGGTGRVGYAADLDSCLRGFSSLGLGCAAGGTSGGSAAGSE